MRCNEREGMGWDGGAKRWEGWDGGARWEAPKRGGKEEQRNGMGMREVGGARRYEAMRGCGKDEQGRGYERGWKGAREGGWEGGAEIGGAMKGVGRRSKVMREVGQS